MRYTLQEIPVSKLVLDPDNPRLYHLRTANLGTTFTEAELEEHITRQSGFMQLQKSIKKRGVEDPIWVKKSNGHYVVHEGNRRTCVLRRLIADGATPPDGIRFDIVNAHVAAEDTTDLEIKINKIIQQTGKKDWSPVGVAAAVHELHYDHQMAEEDIAVDMQVSTAKVKRHLKDYRMYTDYYKATGDTNEKRFTYFAEAPKKVIDWIEDSERNRNDYYDWINPQDGLAKIRSAAAGRGSLREFAKCLEDPDAMNLLREVEHASVEDAYDVVKSNDIKKDITVLTRILPMAHSLRELDEIQLGKIASDRVLVRHIESLSAVCQDVLGQIEQLSN